MKMIDMKLPKEKKKKTAMLEAAPMMADEKYPWGLKIDLNKQSLKALGKNSRDFELGERINVSCVAEVVNLREDQRQGQENDESVGFQIIQMGIGKGKAEE